MIAIPKAKNGNRQRVDDLDTVTTRIRSVYITVNSNNSKVVMPATH